MTDKDKGIQLIKINENYCVVKYDALSSALYLYERTDLQPFINVFGDICKTVYVESKEYIDWLEVNTPDGEDMQKITSYIEEHKYDIKTTDKISNTPNRICTDMGISIIIEFINGKHVHISAGDEWVDMQKLFEVEKFE